MTTRPHRLALLGALALSSCAHPPVVTGEKGDIPTRMAAIAERYETSRHEGGMAGVIADIEKCYRSATTIVVAIYPLRDCMTEDFYAAEVDGVVGKKLNGGHLPYFEPATVTARFNRYGNLAGFRNVPHMVRYLTDTFRVVSGDVNAMHATPVVTDHWIGIPGAYHPPG